MSDTPVPPEQTTGRELDVAVDLAAFLPDGVVLGDPEGAEHDAESGPTGPDEPTGDATDALPVAAPARPDSSGLDALQGELDAVDAALVALDAGTYGTCTACGAAIDDHLLADAPTRATCAAH